MLEATWGKLGCELEHQPRWAQYKTNVIKTRIKAFTDPSHSSDKLKAKSKKKVSE